MTTYISGQSVVNVALRKCINELMYIYIIKLLSPYWPRIDTAIDPNDYHDDASPHHVRNTLGNITERMPLVARVLTGEDRAFVSVVPHLTFVSVVPHRLQRPGHPQHDFSGPHPVTFKGPQDITDLALTTINNWLDDTDLLWKVLQAYPECAATEGQRWMELLHRMKKWSENDRNKFEWVGGWV
jgi:hypothetical protein